MENAKIKLERAEFLGVPTFTVIPKLWKWLVIEWQEIPNPFHILRSSSIAQVYAVAEKGCYRYFISTLIELELNVYHLLAHTDKLYILLNEQYEMFKYKYSTYICENYYFCITNTCINSVTHITNLTKCGCWWALANSCNYHEVDILKRLYYWP